jgi:hypothetical protein
MKQKRLETIDGATLAGMELEDIRYIVDSFLPQGLHILAGAPKAGKSWLLLGMGIAIANGEKIFDMKTRQGTVLYLCLEDSLNRIRSRLLEIMEEVPGNIYFATMAESISDGLIPQIENFIAEHPDTVLVAVDTLQMVRQGSSESGTYSGDYNDIGILKRLADKYKIALIVVQHLRKQFDSDPHQMVTGSTGLLGAADSSFVLQKEKVADANAKLFMRGRDIEERIFNIRFNAEGCVWEFVSCETPESEAVNSDTMLKLLTEFMKAEKEFLGTSTELCEIMKSKFGVELKPNSLSKKLNRYQTELASLGIEMCRDRSGSKREIFLLYNDGMTVMTVQSGDIQKEK